MKTRSTFAFAALVATVLASPLAWSTNISDNGMYVSAAIMHVTHHQAERTMYHSERNAGTHARGFVYTELDKDIGFAVSTGYEFGDGLRAELELARRHAGYSMNGNIRLSDAMGRYAKTAASGDGEIASWSLMANTIYSFRQLRRVHPYIGAGLGVVRHEDEVTRGRFTASAGEVALNGSLVREGVDDTVLGYQLMAGIGIPITGAVEGRAGYRFFATANPEFDGEEVEYATHNLEVGVFVRF